MGEFMTYIIADIGSNFTTLQEAYISIEKAKEAGADMAKFQYFSEFDLYGDGERKRNLADGAWLHLLKECCDLHKIDFGCTAFSVGGAAEVDPFVKCHKIASSCVTHIALLEAINATRKMVYMSVGACTTREILAAYEMIHSPMILMCCQASYPSRMYNPYMIDALRALTKSDVGYSDHTTDIWGSAIHACGHGVAAIEKHFTAFPLLQSPDRPHSLTPSEFKMMVDAIRNGLPEEIGPSPEEAEFVKYCKVRKTDKGYYRVRKC